MGMGSGLASEVPLYKEGIHVSPTLSLDKILFRSARLPTEKSEIAPRHILSRPYIEIFFDPLPSPTGAILAIRIVEQAVHTLEWVQPNLPKNGALVLFGNPNAEKTTSSDARFPLEVSCRFGMGYSFPALDCPLLHRNSCRLFR